MGDRFPHVKVAVVQAAPVLFDREATVERTCQLIDDAAGEGAQLILFPEAFIPAYPRGLSFGTVVGSRRPAGRQTWERYWANAVDVPGPSTARLGRAARHAGAYVAVGVIERDQHNSQLSESSSLGGTLYCTLLYFGPDGTLLGLHRKLKPTGAERLIWGEGDGSTLTVLETPLGRVGGLICWENYMPLARMALYGKRVEIYLAPTADARDTWQATLRHIACEGRCFVLGCNQFVTKDHYPADLPGIEELKDLPDTLCRGGSAILSPLGEYLAGPSFDREEMLFADLDLADVAQARFDLDVVGHYARPDVFQLSVNEQPALTVRARAATTPDPAFWHSLDRLVAASAIRVDRPKGMPHPTYPDFIYPYDYGYLENTQSADGGGIDVWIGTLRERTVTGVIYTVDLGKKDSEAKLLLGCTPQEAQEMLATHNTGEQSAILILRPPGA
jgi:nitrilase